MSTETKSKHTAEPWAITAKENERYKVVGTDGLQIAVFAGMRGWLADDANAARAVACVNACADIGNPEGMMKEVRKALRKIIDAEDYDEIEAAKEFASQVLGEIRAKR